MSNNATTTTTKKARKPKPPVSERIKELQSKLEALQQQEAAELADRQAIIGRLFMEHARTKPDVRIAMLAICMSASDAEQRKLKPFIDELKASK